MQVRLRNWLLPAAPICWTILLIAFRSQIYWQHSASLIRIVCRAALYTKFGSLLNNAKPTVYVDYQAFKQRLIGVEQCKTTADVYILLVLDPVYQVRYRNLVQLAAIALTLPMSTAWPERGFSALLPVKKKLRNRPIDNNLSALLNLSINGPTRLSVVV